MSLHRSGNNDALGSTMRIYIVDDHPLVRSGLAAMISQEPDMTLCGQTEDYATALREIVKLQPDVALVDLSLKGNSGLDLIKSLSGFKVSTRTCVLSVHDESVFALRALKAGARGYVMKQEVIDKVLYAIRHIHRGQIFVSPDVLDQMLQPLRPETPAAKVDVLSDRELEVVMWLGRGTTTREIAASLHVSVKTVETYRAGIKRKMNLHSAPELMQFCVRWVESAQRGFKSDENAAVAEP